MSSTVQLDLTNEEIADVQLQHRCSWKLGTAWTGNKLQSLRCLSRVDHKFNSLKSFMRSMTIMLVNHSMSVLLLPKNTLK